MLQIFLGPGSGIQYPTLALVRKVRKTEPREGSIELKIHNFAKHSITCPGKSFHLTLVKQLSRPGLDKVSQHHVCPNLVTGHGSLMSWISLDYS